MYYSKLAATREFFILGVSAIIATEKSFSLMSIFHLNKTVEYDRSKMDGGILKIKKTLAK